MSQISIKFSSLTCILYVYKYVQITPYLSKCNTLENNYKTMLGHNVYIKEGNTMSILNNNSFQKNSTKEGVILGQLFRIFKISTSMADFNKAYLVLKDNLKSNNYDINYIRSLNVNFTIENQLLIKSHKSCKNYNEEKHRYMFNFNKIVLKKWLIF